MKAISQSVGDAKVPASIEQTDNAVVAPTPGVRDGSLTVRQLVDSYMAGYAGRDSSRPQRLGFWVSALGQAAGANDRGNQRDFAVAAAGQNNGC